MTPREAITQTRADGRQRDVRCPAHEDRRASLSVGRGDDGRALITCHAGCTPDAILDAAGLTWADVMPERTRTTERRIVASYRYDDEHGAHLFDVVRFEPKDFRQRRADGTWSMAGVRRVLYRLPLLTGHDTIYVVEGEKDADALAALGLTATCNPGGAGKWRAEYAGMLRSAGCTSVIILPDADDPGRAHARDVAGSCHTAGLKVRVLELPSLPPKGDVSDWLAAGGTADALDALARACADWTPTTTSTAPSTPAGRLLTLTKASTITIQPVRYLWDYGMSLGSFGLLAGREGIGKTILFSTLAAQVTRGTLPGVHFGTPRAVIIAATEDSWAHTVVPRLMAAGADLDRVYRVDVATETGTSGSLSLPLDLAALAAAIQDVGAVLVVLDPLLSRLDGAIDSHKDAEVRQALEPLAALAADANICILGLIHVNKSASGDPLTMIMASRAFAAVARFVLFAMVDPHDDARRLLGLAKNNVGRSDLPVRAYRISGHLVGQTAEGDVWTGRLDWLGETEGSLREAVAAASDTSSATITQEAAEWLADYLTAAGGAADSAAAKRAGQQAGHSAAAIRRARERLRVRTTNTDTMPRRTIWSLPAPVQSCHARGGTHTTSTTSTTGLSGGDIFTQPTTTSRVSRASGGTLPDRGTTGGTTVDLDDAEEAIA